MRFTQRGMQQGHTGFWVGIAIVAIGCVVARLMGADWIAIVLIAPFSVAAIWIAAVDRPFVAAPLPNPGVPICPKQPDLADLLHHPDFDAILCGLPMPALIVADARVMAANAGALSLLGQHILGTDVRTAIRHPAAADRLANPNQGSRGSVTELVGLGRGNQRWDMCTVPLSSHAAGQARLVLLEDQSAFETTERMRSDFVANASHELRTPLAAILGFVETLQDDSAGGDASTRHRFLSVIHAESHRMQILVDDLISLSRIEAVKYQPPETSVNITELVNRVVDEMRNAAPVRGADIVVETAQTDISCRADAVQMSQMLHNIINNAMKYGKLATPVHISVTELGHDMLRIAIADQGDGIAEVHIPRLTERFYRVDSARSRAMGGTGLGLSIVKHIVERHRGRLDIASTPGAGTIVTILIPTHTENTPEIRALRAMS